MEAISQRPVAHGAGALCKLDAVVAKSGTRNPEPETAIFPVPSR